MTEFLDTHTSEDKGGVSSTHRDSKSAPYHWKQDLPFQSVIEIQDACSKAMRLWGYRKYENPKEVEDLDSVLPLRMNRKIN